jgi:hypothetical protein
MPEDVGQPFISTSFFRKEPLVKRRLSRAVLMMGVAGLLMVLWAARGAFGDDLFFHDGRTDWKIYLSPQAGATETFAAEELSIALKKISGADFEVLSSAQVPERRAIVIGDLENSEVEGRAAALKLSPGKVEQIVVCTLDGRLYLAGNQPRGALYAVYRFLQHELGVRWLWPGPEGEFMPARKSWSRC